MAHRLLGTSLHNLDYHLYLSFLNSQKSDGKVKSIQQQQLRFLFQVLSKNRLPK